MKDSDGTEKKGIMPTPCPHCGGMRGDCRVLGDHLPPSDLEIPMPEVKEPAEYSDTELLDWLQSKLGTHTGKVIWRWSTTGRGWRLHESRWPGAVDNVREAIINAIKAEKIKEEEELEDNDDTSLDDENFLLEARRND